jgi:hypothetical protein
MRRFNVYLKTTGDWKGCGVLFMDGSSAFNRDTGEITTLGPLATELFWPMSEVAGLEVRWVDNADSEA